MEFESWSDLRIPYALDENDQKVEPHKANKESVYRCPECGQELVLRIGVVRTTHFAHRKGEGKCVFYGPDWEQYSKKHNEILHKAKERESQNVEERAAKPSIEESPARDTVAAPERNFPATDHRRPTPAIETWREEIAALAEPAFMVQGELTRVELLCGLVARGCPIPARRSYWGSAKGKPAAHVRNECMICPYYGGHTEAALLCRHPGWAEKEVIS